MCFLEHLYKSGVCENELMASFFWLMKITGLSIRGVFEMVPTSIDGSHNAADTEAGLWTFSPGSHFPRQARRRGGE